MFGCSFVANFQKIKPSMIEFIFNKVGSCHFTYAGFIVDV